MPGNIIGQDPNQALNPASGIFGGPPVTGLLPLPGIYGVPGVGFPGPAVTEAALIDLSDAAGRQGSNAVSEGFWNFFGALFGQPAGRIIFQYMPEGFTESKTAEYANVNIIGRSEPVLGYSHSGPRVFNITLTLVAGETPDPVFDVIRPLWLARSWLYPDYSDTAQPNVPPKLLFVVGAWLRQMVVLTRLDIQYQAPWSRVHYGSLFGSTAEFILGSQLTMPEGGNPLVDSMIPHRVDLNMTLQEVSPTAFGRSPPGTIEVRQGADRPGKTGGPAGISAVQEAFGKILKGQVPDIVPLPF